MYPPTLKKRRARDGSDRESSKLEIKEETEEGTNQAGKEEDKRGKKEWGEVEARWGREEKVEKKKSL